MIVRGERPPGAPLTFPIIDHPYGPFIQRVKKPSQYLGGETGQHTKPWDDAHARMCLAFPDLYEVGMSHLGYKILYSILNNHPRLLADRAYAPWQDMEAQLRAHGIPLHSLESKKPLRDFDVVGFSLQFELTYTNVLLMLDLGGIPLRSDDRREGDPLVLCGGPVATHAEPIAPFADALLIGDGEERTPEVLLTWVNLKRAGVRRRDRLRALANLEGIYVPSLYGTAQDADSGLQVVTEPQGEDPPPFPVQRTFVKDIDRFEFPTDGPVAATETVFDRMSVEIARGCTEGCRFCQAGMIYRPVRERSPEQIVGVVERAVREGGYDEASLTSLSTADYSAIAPLVKEVMARTEKQKVSLSVSSLRAYGLGEDVLDDLKQRRTGGLTFAPEAGSQRMRDVVNKNVTEEQLMETAERVFSRGWQRMKLYFMIGLPTEEEEDVRGIVQTGERAQRVGKRLLKGRGGAQVTVSVSTHVPKPHTPFQWCAMDPPQTVQQKQSVLREEAKRARIKLKVHASQGSWLEGIFARGDRPLADVIESAYRAGARFDSWEECLRIDLWQQAFETHRIDTEAYLGTLPVTGRLPWDHIHVGLADGFLAREYKKALRNRLSPPCGKAVGDFVHHTTQRAAEADERKLVCYHCGVACDMSLMRTERIDHLKALVDLRTKRELELFPQLPKRPAENPNPEPPPAEAPKPPPKPAEDPRPPRVPAQPPADPKPARALRFLQPPKAKQIPPTAPPRVRVAYQRTGAAAYTSHLDVVRVLPRILRIAEIPVHLTEGFHPKPSMTFGPSLPVGTPSLAEYVDVKIKRGALDQLGSESALLTRLQNASLNGMRFFAVRTLERKDSSVAALIDELHWLALIDTQTANEHGLHDAQALHDRWQALRKNPRDVFRTVKGIKKRVPVHEHLLRVSVATETQRLDLRRGGVIGDGLVLRLTIAVSPRGTSRVGEALEFLTGQPVVHQAVRIGATGRGTDPLDLHTARALQQSVPPQQTLPMVTTP